MRASSEEADSWLRYLGLALGLHKLQLSVEWKESRGLSRDSVIFLKHRFSPGLACKKQWDVLKSVGTWPCESFA